MRFSLVLLCASIISAHMMGCSGTQSSTEKMVSTPVLVSPQPFSAIETRENPAPEVADPLPSPTNHPSIARCKKPVCVISDYYPFIRPIQPPGREIVERSYPYGSTQKGQREPHHGIDLINKAGVPVMAVANGIVVFAGDDLETAFGPKYDFYGKLVIIEHLVSGYNVPLFTLYGHLLEVKVATGDSVKAGETIGLVGLGGVAAGTHLHFEVRYAVNDYNSTLNPELWIAPPFPTGGQMQGALAGRFENQIEDPIFFDNIVLEVLNGTNSNAYRRLYLSTYEDQDLIDRFPWQESFGIGELIPGSYRLSYIYKNQQNMTFEIEPGMLTYLSITIP